MVPTWPPLEESLRASHKLRVIEHLDKIAKTITQSPRPVTKPWLPGDTADENVVIKCEGSDCCHHVILDTKHTTAKLETDEAKFSWFTQTRIEMLRSIGKWHVLMVGRQMLRVVNTMPSGAHDMSLFHYSQRDQGLPLSLMK